MVDQKGFTMGKIISPRLLQLEFWAVSLTEVLAWYLEMEYTGHTLKKQGTGWFLVVRAKQDTVPLVAYFAGATAEDCFYLFAYGIKHYTVVWKDDKYA